jgi:hypothetical protein
MEHKWLRNFDENGNWTKPERVIVIGGVEHDLDKYAKDNGIELPKGKKVKKQDIEVNSNADMGQTQSKGDSPEHGDGDSEGSE